MTKSEVDVIFQTDSFSRANSAVVLVPFFTSSLLLTEDVSDNHLIQSKKSFIASPKLEPWDESGQR